MQFWVALETVLSGIWSFLTTFFNSNFFLGLSTILTVLVAILLYFRQKKSEKQQIAALLVNEIRNAEEAIHLLKTRTRGVEIPEIIILPQNNWNKFSHLFSKDFDQDEVNTINRFYFDAERANYIVNYGNTVDLFLLNIRERIDASHHKVLDIIDKASSLNDLKVKMKRFQDKFYNVNSFFQYSPVGFTTILDSHLATITFILDSPVGIKLKQLAGLKEKKR